MKKFVTASLFVFWAIIVAVLTDGLVAYENKKNAALNSSLINQGSTGATQNVGGTKTINLDKVEVAKHSSSADCWVIVEGNVYNLTQFLGQHSGGGSAIVPYCGKDGTNAFLTKDQSPSQSHQGGDLSILNVYKLGALNQSVTPAVLQQSVQQTNQVTTPTRLREREDDD